LWLSDSAIRIGVARGGRGSGLEGLAPSMGAADALFLCGSWASCLTLSTVMNKLQHEYVGTLSQFLLQAKRFNANFRLTRPSLTSSSANDVTLVACRLLFHPSKEIIDRISEVKQAWSRFTFHSHWVSYKWLQANLSLCNRYRLQLPVRRPTW